MRKKAKRSKPTVASELNHLRTLAKENAVAIEYLKRDCATNLRRCAEMQAEIDALKKRLG